MLNGLHIEPTNICTLKCPRCSRTEFIEQFPGKWKNHSINLDHLKSFIDIDLINKFINIRGSYGDPIYYNELIELVKWLKERGAFVEISTNGSYKTAEWWEKLCEPLDERDTVIFAIDGTPDNFTKYRINADWVSIEMGIKVATQSRAITRWEYLPFSFNTDTIEEARQISTNLGVSQFVVKPSDRWQSDDDWLRPNKDGLTNEIKIISLKQWKETTVKTNIAPKCHSGSEHYISADGFYMPCCFIADHRYYYKSEFYKNKNKFDISKTTLSQVLSDKIFQEFYSTIEVNKPVVCMYNCPKL